MRLKQKRSVLDWFRPALAGISTELQCGCGNAGVQTGGFVASNDDGRCSVPMTSVVNTELHIWTQPLALLDPLRSKEVTFVAIKGRLPDGRPPLLRFLLRALMVGGPPMNWGTIRPKEKPAVLQAGAG